MSSKVRRLLRECNASVRRVSLFCLSTNTKCSGPPPPLPPFPPAMSPLALSLIRNHTARMLQCCALPLLVSNCILQVFAASPESKRKPLGARSLSGRTLQQLEAARQHLRCYSVINDSRALAVIMSWSLLFLSSWFFLCVVALKAEGLVKQLAGNYTLYFRVPEKARRVEFSECSE